MRGNIKTQALRAAAFVISGDGLSKIIRLLSNLILTRLLVPEFFGVIAIARTLDTGIALFSDIGLQPGIIRSERAKDPDFLNTAWTLSVLRGVALWPISVLVAVPAARFYNEPLLVYIVPLISLSFIIRGFQSTSFVVLNKELRQGKLTIIELSTHIVNVVTTITLAYFFRNIWALVIGSLVSEIVKTVWSHLLKGHEPARFKLDKSATGELLSFGKWIFVSTAMMFLASQADRLILGKYFDPALFGVYYIALLFADLPKKVVSSLSQKVLFPVFSRVSSLPRPELRQKISDQRKAAMILIAVFTALFAGFGDLLILALYDSRYADAAWMLPLLVVGIWPRVVMESLAHVLFAVNKPNYSAAGNFAKLVYMIVFIPIFYKAAGVFGAVIAVALNDLPVYILINVGLVKERLALLKQDAYTTLIFIAVIFICILVRTLAGIDFPVINY